MAKSARASSRKKNNVNLRAKVFGPALEARTERLSAKLQELAARPKPESKKVAKVNENEDKQLQNGAEETLVKDVEMQNSEAEIPKVLRKSRKSGRIQKTTGKKKARNMMVFRSEIARERRKAAKNRKR